MDIRRIAPDSSTEHNSSLQRRGSTSSIPSVSSAGPPTDHRSFLQHTAGPSTVQSRDLTAAGSQPIFGRSSPLDATESRREGESTMRTQSTIDDPVTYTPTTHRVSKAKKGKRVHACEYPGCGKVFTRAEHRRRHELNHSPEASFPCPRAGCRKAFHRQDLLARHRERHDLEDQAAASGQTLSSRRSATHQPASSDMSPSLTPMGSPAMISLPTQPHSNPLDIRQLVNRSAEPGSTYGHPLGMGYTSQDSHTIYPIGFVNPEEPCFYSSPESGQSPASDCYGRYSEHRNSMSSSSSVMDIYAPTGNSLVPTSMAGWAPVIPADITSSNSLEDDSNGLPSVDLSVSVSNLDGDDWSVIRRELGHAPGIVSDNAGMAVIDHDRWSNYLDLYSHLFNPLFPIVTLPRNSNFLASKPSPLLAGVMAGIGAQLDTNRLSMSFSQDLLETSLRIFNKRDHITGQSRLSDLQTVFLLEILRQFGSRRVNTEVSSRFRFLYSSLAQAQHWISTNPLAVLKALRGNFSSSEIKRAYNFWIDHETRRRILQACFIHDTFQAVLFGQQPVLTQFGAASAASIPMGGNLPFPCSSALWESATTRDWSRVATDSVHDNISLREATANALSSNPKPLDTFQSLLIFSQILTHHRHTASFPLDLMQFYSNLSAFNRPTESPDLCVNFTYHVLLAAFHTPIRSLLIVSGESWLHGRKIEDKAEFQSSKQALRQWVDAGTGASANAGTADSLKALWHASRLLALVLRPTKPSPAIQDVALNIQPPLHIPHESWSIYICTLICWACGLDSESSTAGSMSTSSSGHLSTTTSFQSLNAVQPALVPSHTALAEASRYLESLTSAQFHAPADLLNLDPDIRGKTDGLLEVIRTQKLSSGENGLVNEAEGVLRRLIEKRGRGWTF